MILPMTKADAKALNLNYYFTGKPCKNGHVTKRRVSNSGCHEYKKYMRELQAKRRSIPDVKVAESQAQSAHRRTDEYREKVKPYNCDYKKANRGKFNAYDAKRSADKLQRTPAWLSGPDKNGILDLYEQSRQLTKATGEEHHVDHIIPLKGVLVSGLHVLENLQILTAVQNMQKNNSFRATV
tara:strand:- start:54 stop:599 length:546 start_codon:yes stop_codon:yes gene_type:complete